MFAGRSGGTTTCKHSQELIPRLLELGEGLSETKEISDVAFSAAVPHMRNRLLPELKLACFTTYFKYISRLFLFCIDYNEERLINDYGMYPCFYCMAQTTNVLCIAFYCIRDV